MPPENEEIPIFRPGMKKVAEITRDSKVAKFGNTIIVADPNSPPKIYPKSTNLVVASNSPIQPAQRRELTVEEMAARNALKVRMGMAKEPTVIQELIASPGQTQDGKIDTVVMNPANPYLSIYREFRAGLISLEEMEESIDLSILNDPKELQGFEFKSEPSKPDILQKAEEEYRAKNPPEQWELGIQKIREKLSQKNEKVAYYVRSCERIHSENQSNLYWLNSMLNRQTSKNQLYAAKIREVILTHQMAA